MTQSRIKDVARINLRTLPEDTDPHYKFRYVDISAVDGMGHVSIPDGDVSFSSAPSRARRTAPAGSVLVSTVRTYLQAIAAVPCHESNLVFSTGFAILEAGRKVDGRYLGYYCRSQQFIDEVVSRSTGVSYPAINPGEIGNVPISPPSLEEQGRIADFLDPETARIDKLIDRRKIQEGNLAEKSYAAVSEILVPGILSDPAGSWPWTWLPKAANDRPLVRLGYVCRLQNGLTVDGRRDVSGDVVTRSYLRVANVQAGSVALDSVTEITVPRDVADRSTLRPGDVLMTEGGDLDKLGRGTVWRGEIPDCLHQNHVFALRPEPARLDGDYLALMTRTLHGRCYFESTGTKTTNLASTNSSKILSFPIPLPDVAVQRKLAAQAQKVLEECEVATRLLIRQRALLAERRQALITAAVTGQFDVSTASGRNVTDGVQP
ncbi:restriction endonuclease subunit S [Streptomyces niveus]|uniref:restriction endonuclease subunit S n=1 Tax=Streptomyces niveus TaxID=193462 RepID=UPI0034454504